MKNYSKILIILIICFINLCIMQYLLNARDANVLIWLLWYVPMPYLIFRIIFNIKKNS